MSILTYHVPSKGKFPYRHVFAVHIKANYIMNHKVHEIINDTRIILILIDADLIKELTRSEAS